MMHESGWQLLTILAQRSHAITAASVSKLHEHSGNQSIRQTHCYASKWRREARAAIENTHSLTPIVVCHEAELIMNVSSLPFHWIVPQRRHAAELMVENCSPGPY